MRASTAGSSSASRRPASTAGRSAPRARRRTRTSSTFPTAAAAEAAGFRPCLRCRPEASPGHAGLGRHVGHRLARAAAYRRRRTAGRERWAPLDDRLASEPVWTTRRTARRDRPAPAAAVSETPWRDAARGRADAARALCEAPARRDVAPGSARSRSPSGFGSVRRFNGQIRRTFSRTPTELRRLRRRSVRRRARLLPLPARLPSSLRLAGDARVSGRARHRGRRSRRRIDLPPHDRSSTGARARSTCVRSIRAGARPRRSLPGSARAPRRSSSACGGCSISAPTRR